MCVSYKNFIVWKVILINSSYLWVNLNSGYFMCVRAKGVEAEAVRVELLDRHGVGVIAAGGSDVRIAFSCLEVEQIPEMFEIIYQGIKDQEKG